MSDLISAQTGNFTTASTWQVVDSVSMLDSEAGSTQLTTLVQASAAFTLPAATYDGVAVKISAINASPSGTFVVRIRNATTTADSGDITLNVTDLPTSANGWVFCKCTPFTANGTDVRVLWLNTSVGSMVTCFTDGTTANWARRFRKTTTQAPTSGNHLIISNQFTAAGASTAVTVTLDNTATTSFGPTVSGGPPEGFVVSGNGTLTLGTATSTAYYLKWKGIMWVCGGGTVNLGSSGGRLNSTSSCVLEMDSVAAGDSNISVDAGGTFNAYGATKDPYAYLTADAASSATGLTVSTATNWATSDNIIIAPTDRTWNNYDNKTISTISGTSITVAALSHAHSGTSPTQAEVINLTRNIKIRGVSSTLTGWFNANATAVVVLSYIEAYQLGINADQKYGIYIRTTTGSFLAEYCGVHDFTVGGSTGFYINNTNHNNWTIDHCGIFNTYFFGVNVQTGTTGTNWAVTNTITIYMPAARCYQFLAINGTIENNTAVGGADYGFHIQSGPTYTSQTILNISGNTTHTNASYGWIADVTFFGVTFGSITSWRNGGPGIYPGAGEEIVYNNLTLFGNTSTNLSMSAANAINNITFNNMFASGDSSFSTGVTADIRAGTNVTFNNCTFDSSAGIFRPHAQTFVNGGTNMKVYCNNCLVNPTTTTAGAWLLSGGGVSFGYRCTFIAFNNYNQSATDHRYLTTLYDVTSDTVIYKTATPSERITPNSLFKAWSGPMTCSVASGATKTISAWVRKSSSGDAGGANYTGNQQRLILRSNSSVGVTSDMVLATASAAVGTWEQLSATTPAASEDGVFEVFVDCDGTAGWVNVDDFAAV